MRFGNALQVVQDRVRTDVWEHFAYARQEQNIKLRLADLAGDCRRELSFRVREVLQCFK